jgi:hypothetical protein
MLWLHIVVLVGLISIIIPAMFFLLLCLKLNNLSRSIIVTVASVIFTVTATFYIYTNLQLYIMVGSVILISVFAGLSSYYLFEKQLKQQSLVRQDAKAG